MTTVHLLGAVPVEGRRAAAGLLSHALLLGACVAHLASSVGPGGVVLAHRDHALHVLAARVVAAAYSAAGAASGNLRFEQAMNIAGMASDSSGMARC